MILSWNSKGPEVMVSIFWVGKYKMTAFLTHSFTTQPADVGSAVLNLPLSSKAMTLLIADFVSSSFRKSRLSQAFSMIPLTAVYIVLCEYVIFN